MSLFSKPVRVADREAKTQDPQDPAAEPTLEQLESVVAQGIAGFAEAGKALAAIKERRLYRAFGTWSEYLKQRWSLTPDYADKLIAAAIVAIELTKAGLPEPLRESHAREINKVPPAHRAEVWTETLADANNDPAAVTAEFIATRAAKHRKPKARRKAPKAITLRGKGWSITLKRFSVEVDALAALEAAAEQLRAKAVNRAA